MPACRAFEENYIIAKLKSVISVIAENIPHANHETHLHTVKVATILIPTFPRSSLGTRGLQTRSHRQKKSTVFLEYRFAQASSTKKLEKGLARNNNNNKKRQIKTLLLALSLACLELRLVVKGAGAVILLFRLECKMSVICHNVNNQKVKIARRDRPHILASNRCETFENLLHIDIAPLRSTLSWILHSKN